MQCTVYSMYKKNVRLPNQHQESIQSVIREPLVMNTLKLVSIETSHYNYRDIYSGSHCQFLIYEGLTVQLQNWIVRQLTYKLLWNQPHFSKEQITEMVCSVPQNLQTAFKFEFSFPCRLVIKVQVASLLYYLIHKRRNGFTPFPRCICAKLNLINLNRI